MRTSSATLVVAIAFIVQTPAAAQDLHIPLPVDSIEFRLNREPLQLLDVRGSRLEGDRTQRVLLGFPDQAAFTVKWAVAPANGEDFNNVPRYEVAAYELQKLFLDENDYVVPPTVIRSFPLEWYREHVQPNARPTFGRTQSVLVAMQFWLMPPVVPHASLDRQRFASDEGYAKHFANLNVLTYLIRHRDSNMGNVLISESETPRMWAVDNGVAFNSPPSDRGEYWRELRVDRIPEETAERLRRITREDLQARLGVLVEFELQAEHFELVERGANLRAAAGSRRVGNTLQFGLTASEIQDVNARLTRLVQQIESGRVATF